MYTLSCILAAHVIRIAVEVEKDSVTAFRIAVALGKKQVDAFQEEWKAKMLKVGDVLLTITNRARVLYGWSLVVEINKKKKNVTLVPLMCDTIKEKKLVQTRPLMNDGIYVTKYARKRVIHIECLRVLFLKHVTPQKSILTTFEVVDKSRVNSNGYITFSKSEGISEKNY
jgi:hypothetical protein